MTIASSPLYLIYDGLFSPAERFKHLAQESGVSGVTLLTSVMTVVVISAMTPLVQSLWSGGELTGLAIQAPFKMIFGLLVWILLSVTIATTAYAFTGQSRLKTFMALSGFSALPWMFMGPIALLKTGLGDMGYFIGLVLAFGVWLWSMVLLGLAFWATYQVSVERMIVLLLMPFSFTLITVIWMLDFVSTLFHLTVS